MYVECIYFSNQMDDQPGYDEIDFGKCAFYF